MPQTKQNQNNINQKQYYNKFNKDFKNGPRQKNLKKKKNISTWPVLTPTVLGPGPGVFHSLLTPPHPSVQSRVWGGVA